MLQAELLNQPWDGPADRLGDVLAREVQNETFSRLLIVVAFAQASGVSHVAPLIRQVLAKGGKAEVFVGLDFGGTSRLALEQLVATGASIHAFHNPASTFHPKLYLLENPSEMLAYVGSANLTEGGLFSNYEMGMVVRLNRYDPVGAALWERLVEGVDMIRMSGNTRDITAAEIDELAKAGLLQPETEETAGEARGIAGTSGSFPWTPVPRAPSPLFVGAEFSQFVMTLGPRDTRNRPGYSPDIFIPLAALMFAPGFWRWQYDYVQVAAPHGTYAERRVTVVVNSISGSQQVPGVRLYKYLQRAEFRLNCGALVAMAPQPGDLLVLQIPSGNERQVDYVATVVKRASSSYSALSAIASNKVRSWNSDKRWGYV